MVSINLGFTDQLFCNLIILIKWCKLKYLNLDKVFLFPRNQVICPKNGKLWRAPSIIKFNIFCWNFAHVSVLPMFTKGCSRFVYFVLFWLFFFTLIKQQYANSNKQMKRYREKNVVRNTWNMSAKDLEFIEYGKNKFILFFMLYFW